MKLFGFTLTKEKNIPESDKIISFSPKNDNDGTSVIETAGGAGYYGQFVDIDGSQFSNERELMMKYRSIATNPDCDAAIADIVDAAIISDDDSAPINLVVDDLDLADSIKKKIVDEFENVVSILNFNEHGSDYFRRWYVDGRLFFHVIVDESKKKNGIVDIVEIDPTKIKKVREVTTKIDRATGIKKVETSSEYFQFTDTNINTNSVTTQNQFVRISTDSIVYVPSGILDEQRKTVISHLHKSLKLVNQLRMMEDSLVIYRVSRAPERRIFYIDVGNLPKGKAEEYVQSIMSKYRNKLVYDQQTGEIRDDRRSLSMLEDFWLPRKEGGRGTEITTLPGGCLSMDTKVSLLDGRELSIADISDEMKNGKELWTYSCHPTTGAILPGLISWAGVTQKKAKVMKITLDNGETIVCTPDHKFPVYDKGFVEAKDLSLTYTQAKGVGAK